MSENNESTATNNGNGMVPVSELTLKGMEAYNLLKALSPERQEALFVKLNLPTHSTSRRGNRLSPRVHAQLLCSTQPEDKLTTIVQACSTPPDTPQDRTGQADAAATQPPAPMAPAPDGNEPSGRPLSPIPVENAQQPPAPAAGAVLLSDGRVVDEGGTIPPEAFAFPETPEASPSSPGPAAGAGAQPANAAEGQREAPVFGGTEAAAAHANNTVLRGLDAPNTNALVATNANQPRQPPTPPAAPAAAARLGKRKAGPSGPSTANAGQKTAGSEPSTGTALASADGHRRLLAAARNPPPPPAAFAAHQGTMVPFNPADQPASRPAPQQPTQADAPPTATPIYDQDMLQKLLELVEGDSNDNRSKAQMRKNIRALYASSQMGSMSALSFAALCKVNFADLNLPTPVRDKLLKACHVLFLLSGTDGRIPAVSPETFNSANMAATEPGAGAPANPTTTGVLKSSTPTQLEFEEQIEVFVHLLSHAFLDEEHPQNGSYTVRQDYVANLHRALEDFSLSNPNLKTLLDDHRMTITRLMWVQLADKWQGLPDRPVGLSDVGRAVALLQQHAPKKRPSDTTDWASARGPPSRSPSQVKPTKLPRTSPKEGGASAPKAPASSPEAVALFARVGEWIKAHPEQTTLDAAACRLFNLMSCSRPHEGRGHHCLLMSCRGQHATKTNPTCMATVKDAVKLGELHSLTLGRTACPAPHSCHNPSSPPPLHPGNLHLSLSDSLSHLPPLRGGAPHLSLHRDSVLDLPSGDKALRQPPSGSALNLPSGDRPLHLAPRGGVLNLPPGGNTHSLPSKGMKPRLPFGSALSPAQWTSTHATLMHTCTLLHLSTPLLRQLTTQSGHRRPSTTTTSARPPPCNNGTNTWCLVYMDDIILLTATLVISTY